MQPDARLRPAIVPRPETGGQAACQAARLDERIEPELVRAFYGEKILLSVSQLENYASCPYRHWAITVLALQEREIWQPQNAETGTLLHGAAELALRDLAAGLQALDPADREGRVRWLQNWISDDLAGRAADWLRQAAGRENLQRFFEPGLLASAGRRSHRQITASLAAIGQQYQHETCLPAYLEWVFGPGQADSLVLGLPGGGELSLRGKVDRIDWQEDPDGAKFRVVDYKSGSQNVDLDSLYAGLSLQLPVYLAAFAASHPACRAWDAAYFRFDRPIVRLPGGKRPTPEKVAALLAKSFGLKSLGFPAEDVPLLLRHTLRQVHSLAAALLGGDIRVRPRKFPGRKAACSYCPMLAVCGFDGQPAGYELLPLLRGRADESGKRLRKRQELIIRLHEAESREGGGSDAADT
jgi:ATP-dependent helicase/nuclease subunit B